jgi:hypothetical protein
MGWIEGIYGALKKIEFIILHCVADDLHAAATAGGGLVG